MENAYLAHHGILGQKKGRRRYQYEDGRLTPEGKKRYAEFRANKRYDSSKNGNMATPNIKTSKFKVVKAYHPSKNDAKKNDLSEMSDAELQKIIARKNMEKSYSNLTAKPSGISQYQNISNNASNAANRAASISDRNAQRKRAEAASIIDLSGMTNAELQAAVNRMNLERNYRNLATENVGDGQKYTADKLRTIGDALAITSSALGIALMAKQLKEMKN